MAINQIETYNEAIFEDIKHTNEYGQEFWYARELQSVLGYSQWRRFKDVIVKAQEACKGSNNAVSDHFADVGKMITLGKGGEREVDDFMLTRYNRGKYKERKWQKTIAIHCIFEYTTYNRVARSLFRHWGPG